MCFMYPGIKLGLQQHDNRTDYGLNCDSSDFTSLSVTLTIAKRMNDANLSLHNEIKSDETYATKKEIMF